MQFSKFALEAAGDFENDLITLLFRFFKFIEFFQFAVDNSFAAILARGILNFRINLV